jgi:cell wall-associated NlpC family hydrolase
MKAPFMRTTIAHILFLLIACNYPDDERIIRATIQEPGEPSIKPFVVDSTANRDTLQAISSTIVGIDTQKVKATEIVNFAKTLIGVPYKYASTDPAVGFDCSGFITYVFRRFNIAVPRSSVDFTNVGKDVLIKDARPGDLILFTGTDSTERIVGHMGIVTDNSDSLRFIHSTSGKQYGVTITSLGTYYQRRFVKVIRIF